MTIFVPWPLCEIENISFQVIHNRVLSMMSIKYCCRTWSLEMYNWVWIDWRGGKKIKVQDRRDWNEFCCKKKMNPSKYLLFRWKWKIYDIKIQLRSHVPFLSFAGSLSCSMGNNHLANENRVKDYTYNLPRSVVSTNFALVERHPWTHMIHRIFQWGKEVSSHIGHKIRKKMRLDKNMKEVCIFN